MTDTYEEFKKFVQEKQGIATVRSHAWLLEGCPRCGCKEWFITNDSWAYCAGCDKGYGTEFAFTNRHLAFFDAKGEHCFMCKGYGVLRDGEECEDCGGRISQ